MDRQIPDLLLEKLALGELTPAEARALEERLRAQGPDARERHLAALRASDAAILAAHPPERAAAVIERRLAAARAARSRGRAALWLGAPAVLAAAVILLWVRLGDDGAATIEGPEAAATGTIEAPAEGGGDGPDEVRLKGLEPHLVVHRRTDGAALRLGEGARARAGDVLQVSYVAAGRRRGAILSIDGRGLVTLHLPERPGAPAELIQEGAVPLAHAYELDDAPGFERFVFVTADGPAARLDVAAVVRAAEAIAGGPAARDAPLSLPAGLSQRSFVVGKPEAGR